ncbi:MAG: hypothetical protein LBH14_00840 [Desulfobulbaceae bacterium]|jgi:hypothetical protein|nr:hypothetical protein [Desulfobulbaceae bacterium]
MRCERLISLIKSWYISVKEEVMAPARMVTFMEKHIATCPVCLEDPDVREEVEKITDIVFPEAKQARALALEAAAVDEEENFVDDIDKEVFSGDGDIIEEDIVSDDDENDLENGEKDE